MASNATKSVNKPTKYLLKKENATVAHANNPIESFDFNDVAAQHEQASFNIAQYRPGDEHKPANNLITFKDRNYYWHGAQSDTTIDQSGNAGKQTLTGTFSFYDTLGNITFSATLNAVELTTYQPVYEGRYIDNIFENTYLTPYGKWTYWVTSDDGMDMTITMTVTGISSYLTSIQYESDKFGNPVGQIPDFGTPWLSNPTVEDIEQVFNITWVPTMFTDIYGVEKNYLLHQYYGESVGGAIITKENALVLFPGGGTIGSRFDDTIYNTGSDSSTIHGLGGNDTLVGGIGSESFFGGTGNDVMLGGAGDDVFYLYTDSLIYDSELFTELNVFVQGNDTITGGSGADIFIFGLVADGSNKKINLQNGVTTITDFTTGEDKLFIPDLYLSNDNIVQGVNPIAQDSDDYVLFDTSTKKLYVDADGSGNQYQAEHFATLLGFNGVLTADGGIS